MATVNLTGYNLHPTQVAAIAELIAANPAPGNYHGFTLDEMHAAHVINQQANLSNISGRDLPSTWAAAIGSIPGGTAPVAPTNTVAPSISGTAQSGQTLTANTGTWTGAPSFSYQWKRGASNISGATGSTYVATDTDVGSTLAVVVTGSNAGGSISATSPNTATVIASGGGGAVAPSNSSVPTISGTAQSGQLLTGAIGTWAGSPTPTYTYQWKRAGTNIAGATSLNYTATDTDVGSVLALYVTGTNASGSATANSVNTATVIAAAASTAPRQVVGAGTASNATLFAASTLIPGGVNGSRAISSFTSTDGGSGQFGYVFLLLSACTNLGGGVYGATFTDVGGTGGWSGTTPTNTTPTTTNSGTSDAPVSRSNDTYVDSSGTYVKFRMDYHATFTGSIS